MIHRKLQSGKHFLFVIATVIVVDMVAAMFITRTIIDLSSKKNIPADLQPTRQTEQVTVACDPLVPITMPSLETHELSHIASDEAETAREYVPFSGPSHHFRAEIPADWTGTATQSENASVSLGMAQPVREGSVVSMSEQVNIKLIANPGLAAIDPSSWSPDEKATILGVSDISKTYTIRGEHLTGFRGRVYRREQQDYVYLTNGKVIAVITNTAASDDIYNHIVSTFALPTEGLGLPSGIRYPTGNRIDWKGDDVEVSASNFYMVLNGRLYTMNSDNLSMHTEPGGVGMGNKRTLFEVNWCEKDKHQVVKLYMTFYLLSGSYDWWLDDVSTMTTYVRKYEKSGSVYGRMGSAFFSDTMTFRQANAEDEVIPDSIHFTNLRILPKFQIKPSTGE